MGGVRDTERKETEKNEEAEERHRLERAYRRKQAVPKDLMTRKADGARPLSLNGRNRPAQNRRKEREKAPFLLLLLRLLSSLAFPGNTEGETDAPHFDGEGRPRKERRARKKQRKSEAKRESRRESRECELEQKALSACPERERGKKKKTVQKVKEAEKQQKEHSGRDPKPPSRLLSKNYTKISKLEDSERESGRKTEERERRRRREDELSRVETPRKKTEREETEGKHEEEAGK